MMGGWHWDSGAGWFGFFFMILFWILIIAGIVLVVWTLTRQGNDRQSRDRGGWPPSDSRSKALDVLEERYARGEIERDEFLQRKKDLVDR